MLRIILKIFVGVLSVFFVACQSASTKKNGYWLSKKKDFLFHDLKEFISDSSLRSNYKSYPAINNSMLDSVLSSDEKYLYSWQQRDTTKNDFTVILDDGELGLKKSLEGARERCTLAERIIGSNWGHEAE